MANEFVSRNGIIAKNNVVISGSLVITGSGISLNGVDVVLANQTSSLTSLSSSFAATSSFANNFTVAGTLTAQTINVQTITSSIEFNTGSTRNGSNTSNTHEFTGSVLMTGSLSVSGSLTNGGGGTNDGRFLVQASTNSEWFSVGVAGGGIVRFNSGGGSTLVAGASSVGRMNIGSLSTSSIPLSIQGIASQTGDLLRIDRDNSSTNGSTFLINASGSVGVGTTSLTGYNLRVNKNITGATTAYGISNRGVIQSDVTTLAIGFDNNLETAASSFTLSQYRHYNASQANIGAGSSISLQIGYYASNNLTGATTNVGFYGDVSSGTNKWNIYMPGTANNYMAGSLGIGNTSSLNTYSISIGKTITGGGTSGAIINQGAIQSDVTTAAFYNVTVASTQATTFTLPSLSHYDAQQGTFGAGSTVSNQYGFRAHSSLTGGTNNFGFRGDIAAGTGRWNLYMGASAQNYILGNLGIGSGKTVPTVALDINGSALITGSLGVTAGITGSLLGTATNATSASFAATASFANNFKVNDVLSIDSASLDYQQNLAVTTGSFQSIVSVATGSSRAAIFDYVTFSGSVSRAGTLYSTWGGSSVEWFENYTADVNGSTAPVTLQAALSGGNIQLQAGISGSAWAVRSLVRLL